MPCFCGSCKLLVKYPNLHILLSGEGILDSNLKLVSMIDSTIKASQVHMLGQRGDVEDVMNALDLFVLSSSGEGWPNVVGEAMASGVSCVVTDVGDAAQIVGSTGYVVPSDDADALAEAAHQFFKQPIVIVPCCQSLRANGLRNSLTLSTQLPNTGRFMKRLILQLRGPSNVWTCWFCGTKWF